ncbi:oligosaccharide flippase family protein [Thalassotalea sp. G20_0]|uniref:oligosaccharide flippase family protein n=1 Tax=Thalassotalea sp. G20_0 TaxID=2821093 RepID=UPI001ADC7240|nr:oligosaccharide flippase family protein [Thalassotalea sp. G20_0]MBO9493574.1 oligosaccharide flippase family protein [Thalassotalea sp. G20_0]
MFNSFPNKSLLQNTIALYVIQLSLIASPVVLIPFLSRALGVEIFGIYMYCLSIAFWFSMVIEYGFQLSATRSIAEAQLDTYRVTSVVQQVQSAKLFLAMLAVVGLVMFLCIVPLSQSNLGWHIVTVVYAIVLGFRPTWYFQGKEDLTVNSLLDVGSAILSLVLIFLFIKKPEDGVWALVFQCGAKAIAYLIANGMIYRQVGGFRVSINGALEALREGFSMFVFTASVSFYTTANGLLLGFFAPAATVGGFLSAEKITKAGLSLLGPISQAIFPRITVVAGLNPDQARQMGLLMTAFMAAFGVTGAVLLYCLSPWLVPFILGPGYESVIPIMQVLSLLIPLIALSNVFGIQYLLPKRKDRVFNQIIISAGAVNLVLAILLAEHFQAIGMAWAVVISEAFVTLAMMMVVLKNKFRY